MEALIATNFFFKKQKDFYRGKVRDVYNIHDEFLAVVACDRISAFDTVLPRPIPYKGQVLNQIAAKFLRDTADICPNWLIETPDPNVSIGHLCTPYPVEMVIRGYLTGHAWRTYAAGKRSLCGVSLPEGMKENEAFPEPIITPAIKSKEGHDIDISREDIIAQKLVPKKEYEKLEAYTRALYLRGVEIAAKRGLILVDTKYEFGKKGETIMLIDEVHTPDSSRYFDKKQYEKRLKKNEPQEQLSKEFVRQWLIENNFMGQKDQLIPEMTDTFIDSVTNKYIHLYEQVTGEPFVKGDYGDIMNRIEANIQVSLDRLLNT